VAPTLLPRDAATRGSHPPTTRPESGGRPTARHTYLAQGLTVITKAVPSGRDGVIALRRC